MERLPQPTCLLCSAESHLPAPSKSSSVKAQSLVAAAASSRQAPGAGHALGGVVAALSLSRALWMVGRRRSVHTQAWLRLKGPSLITRHVVAEVSEEASAGVATLSSEADSAKLEKRPRLRLDRDESGAMGKVMLTTPLFYANGSPHLGSAYPTMAADVFARYCRLQGAEVHFVTGMDEHGEKIARTAADGDKTPQELVDSLADEFKSLWGNLSISNNHFARTTSAAHRPIVYEFWQRCVDSGDIYKKDYEGLYCVGCEAYLDDDEMEDGVCKIHRKAPELRREENYFFKLSRYWDDIRTHIEENPDFILPPTMRNQVLYWLRDENRRDFSISRASTKWGIPVPGDDADDQVIYVWFDALLGYLSSLLEEGDSPTLDAAMARGWPADIHVIGKDILRFHAIYWPAMLMSAGLPLPKHICTHGFLTKDGLKMGKSLGNVVEPTSLVSDFGGDAVRYFFSGCLTFGDDGDFTYEAFVKRVNSSLANELGNLVNRVLNLCRKNLDGPTTIQELLDDEGDLLNHPVYLAATRAPEEVAEQYERFDLTKAATLALEIAGAGNAQIMITEPWVKLKGEEADRRMALRELLILGEALRICAVLLSPMVPELSKKLLSDLGVEGEVKWSDAKWRGEALPGLAAGGKPKPLFQRIDVSAWEGK